MGADGRKHSVLTHPTYLNSQFVSALCSVTAVVSEWMAQSPKGGLYMDHLIYSETTIYVCLSPLGTRLVPVACGFDFHSRRWAYEELRSKARAKGVFGETIYWSSTVVATVHGFMDVKHQDFWPTMCF